MDLIDVPCAHLAVLDSKLCINILYLIFQESCLHLLIVSILYDFFCYWYNIYWPSHESSDGNIQTCTGIEVFFLYDITNC